MTRKEVDDLTYRIIGCAIEVHKALGPGLLESVYHRCLAKEFQLSGLNYVSEIQVQLEYKGEIIDNPLRCDFLVEDSIMVELKAVDAFIPLYEATLLSYMRMKEKPKGILLNFNCIHLFREGQKTFVNSLYSKLSDQ